MQADAHARRDCKANSGAKDLIGSLDRYQLTSYYVLSLFIRLTGSVVLLGTILPLLASISKDIAI